MSLLTGVEKSNYVRNLYEYEGYFDGNSRGCGRLVRQRNFMKGI